MPACTAVKEKITPSAVNSMRSQKLYRATQGCALAVQNFLVDKVCLRQTRQQAIASLQAGNPSWHRFTVPHYVVRSTKALYVLGIWRKLEECPC